MPDSQQRQDRIMFWVGLGLIAFLVIVFLIDAHQTNQFDASGSLVSSVTLLIMFLLGGDVVRRRL